MGRGPHPFSAHSFWTFLSLHTFTTIHLACSQAAGTCSWALRWAVGTGAWTVLLAVLGEESAIDVAEGRPVPV